MSPAPDIQPRSDASTDSRMKKQRFEKRYDSDESLTEAIMDIGDERGTYRLTFTHTSHGRLEFQSISKADGSDWNTIDTNALAEIHEALRVAGRVAQDDRLGVDTPLTGTDIAADIDVYDDINPDGYVSAPDSAGARAGGSGEAVTDGSGSGDTSAGDRSVAGTPVDRGE